MNRLSGSAAAFAVPFLLLVPKPALAATGLDGAGMGWPWALPFVGDAAVDRDRAAAVSEDLASPLRQDRRSGGAVLALVAAGGVARPAGRGRGVRPRHAGRVSQLHRAAVCALCRWRAAFSSPAICAARLPSMRRCSALGTAIASFVGTTGAAMILIRPLLRANELRVHKVHIVIFFIILVANVGGALTPLGDPPLFVGFLRGVDFFWTAQNICGCKPPSSRYRSLPCSSWSTGGCHRREGGKAAATEPSAHPRSAARSISR